MRVSATVPTRIDLAGGTLDVYPLYLFEGGGLTVNAAVDVRGYVTVEERSDEQIHIRSEDTGTEVDFASLDRMTVGGALDLVKRTLRYYRPRRGVNVTLRCEAPRGSGLGASMSGRILLCSSMAGFAIPPRIVPFPPYSLFSSISTPMQSGVANNTIGEVMSFTTNTLPLMM